MSNSINPAPREAWLWLAGIRRRIGGKTSIRNPYLFTQLIMFSINILRIGRGLCGFVEPFCFHSNIKKAIVIYFDLMRFVNELFALLSGLSKDVVPRYFEQRFSTIYGLESGMSMVFSACLLVLSEIF
jgi:hypothetical protein